MKAMRYAILGSTGRKVSVVGLGGAQFGIYNEKITIADGANLVRRAYDSGINYFDTSPWYGYNSGQSEKTFGEGLKGLDRSSFVMATKVGRYERDLLKMFDFSAETTEASVKRSLEFLQMDYIDTVQIHDFEYADSIDQILTETLPALDRLRQRGLIKYIGLGTYSLPKIKEVLERSTVKIDSVLNHSCLTLIDYELLDYVDFLKAKGVALLNASALAHGLLMSGEMPEWLSRRAPAEIVAASRKAVELCKQEGHILERLSIGYCAQEGQKIGVNALLTGADSFEQLQANIGVILDGLNPEENAMCDRLRREVFGSLKIRNWGNDDVVTLKQKIQAARRGEKAEW